MSTDYDAPRVSDDDGHDELGKLRAVRGVGAQSAVIDDDDATAADRVVQLPGADLSALSADDLTITVLPPQADEFTCTRCFLLHHRSRRDPRLVTVCRDCA